MSKYSVEAIDQAIKQGPITSAYQADSEHLVEQLNRLRSTEIASYLLYMQHAYMAVSLLSPGLRKEFEAHAAEELAHADMLADRVQQLGGVPLFDFNDIAQQSLEAGVSPQPGGTLADMVVQDLMIEREQVDACTRLVTGC